jgi:hypothetical protein
MITFEKERGCTGINVIDKATGRDMYVQLDFDFPGLASTFGWSPAPWRGCKHEGTDGTIRCEGCGKSATAFISEAYDWLLENEGIEAEDPGYFED